MIKNLTDYKNRDRVIEELAGCDWRGGRSLAKRLRDNSLGEKCGKHAVYILLSDRDETMAVCVLGERDEIDSEWKPWLGYVYTFPSFRGQRAMGKLISFVCSLLKKQGIEDLYVSSNEKGLYEKYGFALLKEMETVKGEKTTVYHRRTTE